MKWVKALPQEMRRFGVQVDIIDGNGTAVILVPDYDPRPAIPSELSFRERLHIWWLCKSTRLQRIFVRRPKITSDNHLRPTELS